VEERFDGILALLVVDDLTDLSGVEVQEKVEVYLPFQWQRRNDTAGRENGWLGGESSAITWYQGIE
jgi:hypothetical protein